MERQSSNRISRFSRASRNSRFSSLYTPEKLARLSSLSRKASLMDAMELEYPDINLRGSGLMSNEDQRFSGRQGSSRFSGGEYSFMPQMQEKDLNRNSNYTIKHECSCNEQECNGVHCSCFLTPREICMIGQCCPTCIEAKNHFLMTTRGWDPNKPKNQEVELDEGFLNLLKQKGNKNMHYLKQIYGNEPTMKNLVFCTCKKSHCQKKYCLCFERGVPCGQYCACLECENIDRGDHEDYDKEEEKRWERYATYKNKDQEEQSAELEDIEKYMHEELREEEFEETMEFEPPNFDTAGQ